MAKTQASPKSLSSTYTVPMVANTLNVLETFQRKGPQLTLNEVMENCGIPKASTYRILETLRHRGYVSRSPQGRYRLTYKLFDIAVVVLGHTPLRKVALPYLEQLQRATGETVNLGIFEEDHVVYTDVLESSRRLRIVPAVGSHGTFHATALGKAILAWVPLERVNALLLKNGLKRFTASTITSKPAFIEELDIVRTRGYAIDNQEESPGCSCIAAPVFDYRKEVVGAVSISAPSSRLTSTKLAQLGTQLRGVALDISHKLGFNDFKS